MASPTGNPQPIPPLDGAQGGEIRDHDTAGGTGSPLQSGGATPVPDEPKKEKAALEEIQKARGKDKAAEVEREEAAGVRYVFHAGNVIFGNVQSQGSIIGRDSHSQSGYSASRASLTPISADELEKIRAVSLVPDYYPRALELLANNSLVLLLFGRGSADVRFAIKLLLEAESSAIDLIGSGVNLGELLSLEFVSRKGYVVQIFDRDGLIGLDRFTVEAIRKKVGKVQAHLAFVVGTDVEIVSDELHEYAISCLPDVEAWFATRRGLADYALMIAIAILGGASHQAVLEAADQLYRSLTEVKDEDRVLDLRFGKTSTARLKETRAHLRSTTSRTPFGTVPVDVVEFDDNGWYTEVLRHLWKEYGFAKSSLADWMAECCTSADPDIGVRAATAAGALSRLDFGYMWRNVLEVWARSDEEALRRAAALALGIPAWDAGLESQVLGSLKEWSVATTDWRLQWTAAASFGTYWIGCRFPTEALQGLHAILESEQPQLVPIAAEGITALFELRSESKIDVDVLSALLEWATSTSSSSVLTVSCLVTFLNVAFGSEVDTSIAGGFMWPRVLWLANTDAESNRVVRTLFQRSLDNPFTRDAALDVLKLWIQEAGEHPELVDPLEVLVLDLADGSRAWQRLRFFIGRWASGSMDEAAVARRLVAALDGRRPDNRRSGRRLAVSPEASAG